MARGPTPFSSFFPSTFQPPPRPDAAGALRLASGERRFDLDTFFVRVVAALGGASRYRALGARDSGAGTGLTGGMSPARSPLQ